MILPAREKRLGGRETAEEGGREERDNEGGKEKAKRGRERWYCMR